MFALSFLRGQFWSQHRVDYSQHGADIRHIHLDILIQDTLGDGIFHHGREIRQTAAWDYVENETAESEKKDLKLLQ